MEIWREYFLNEMSSVESVQFRKQFSNFNGKFQESIEDKLKMTFDFARLVKEGKRDWYILFSPGKVRIPIKENVVTGLKTEDFKVWEDFGKIYVPKMSVGTVKYWPEKCTSIWGAGWDNKQEMIAGLNDIYGPIYGRELESDDMLVAWNLKYLGNISLVLNEKKEKKFHFFKK
jgi:hypothetical protein